MHINFGKEERRSEQSRDGQVQRAAGRSPAGYADAHGHDEVRRSMHLQMLQVSARSAGGG